MRTLKYLSLLSIFAACYFPGLCQLNINGATFFVQTGATVTVQGDIQNAGTFTNDGSVRVQGSFTNSSLYNGSVSGLLEMYGTGNVTLNGGSSTINNLIINKTSATDRVLLNGSTTVGQSLTHTNGVFSTDPINNPAYLLSAPATASFTFSTGKEIVGKVKRTGWTNGSARVFNNTNMLVTTNGGTNPTDITVTMIPFTEGGDPTQAEREVKRKFNFAATGGSGYTADVRYPYFSGELNTNVENNLVPWQLVSSEWNAQLTPVTRDVVNRYVTTTGIPAASFTQEWKLADPKYTFNVTAYIKGAWNNPTALMRTVLAANNKLPLSQPYTAAPYSYLGTETVSSIPNANVVDWVLIEYRKPITGLPADANAISISGRRAAFLLNNGSVVDLDGVTPIAIDITKQGTGFIVVRHRNHLAIMSNGLASNSAGTFTNNFAVFANSYKKPSATSDPTVTLSASAPGNTLYGMWPGDVNANGSITASDITPINIAIAGPAAGNTDIYNVRDINLDRNVTTSDVSITNTSIAAFAATSSSRPINVNSEKTLTSHVPGEGKK